MESVEDKWEAYQDTVMEAYHHCFPEKTVQLHPSDAPWVTHRIKRILQQRDRAHRLRNMDRYKRLRNKVIREIRIAKKNYYPSKLQHLKQANISQWYDKLNELTGRSKKQPSSLPFAPNLLPEEVVEQINTHFSSICQKLPPLDHNNLPAFLPAPTPPVIIEES